jgi:hypothetical protein
MRFSLRIAGINALIGLPISSSDAAEKQGKLEKQCAVCTVAKQSMCHSEWINRTETTITSDKWP